MCNVHNLCTLHFTTETLNELRGCCKKSVQGWQPQSHALPDVPDAEDSAAPKIKANCMQSLMILSACQGVPTNIANSFTIHKSHLFTSYHHFSIYHLSNLSLLSALPCPALH